MKSKKYLLPVNAILVLVFILGFAAFSSALFLSAAPVLEDEWQIMEESDELVLDPETALLPDPETDPAEVAEPGEITVAEDGLETLPDPIDPQSWKLQRSMDWKEWKPNPVIDWVNDTTVKPARVLKGVLVLVDFPDRKFLVTEKEGSDILGNPVIGGIATEDLADFWHDYLIVPSEQNNYVTVNSYWRENTYGRQDIELSAHGPYTLSRFEFQYSSLGITTVQRFDTFFPRGTGMATEAYNLAKADGVKFFDAAGQPLYDFIFFIHAGYDPSGLWQEVGEMMFLTRGDITEEFSGLARLETIEEMITAPGFDLAKEYPGFYLFTKPTGTQVEQAYLSYKEVFFASEYAAAKAVDPALSESVFETATFRPAFNGKFADDAAYKAMAPDILLGNILRAKQAAYNTDGNLWMRWAATRYVPWTTWLASMNFWTTEGTVRDAEYNYTFDVSTQAESDGMATFAHEFGHIRSLPDNYNAPYTLPMTRSYTGPWELMSRGSFGGPGGNHQRYQIPATMGGASPPNQVLDARIINQFTAEEDIVNVTVSGLIAGGPAVAEIVARNIPTNNSVIDYGVNGKRALKLTGFTDATARDNNTLDPTNNTSGNLMNFPDALRTIINPNKWNWGTFNSGVVHDSYSIEVVDRTGYDSFTNDHGVLILKNASRKVNYQPNQFIVDAHPGPLGIVDFVRPSGDPAAMTNGDQLQLVAALFHAGVHNDPDYADVFTGNAMYGPIFADSDYATLAEPIITKAAGNTVNEYVDESNKLHFYILEKITNPAKNGEYLSYQIAVRSTDAAAHRAGGTLSLTAAEFEPATKGRYAVQWFTLKDTGADVRDIIRITLYGALAGNAAVLNNLYAIEPDGSIKFAVYIKAEDGDLTAFPADKLTVRASSETNTLKNAATEGALFYTYSINFDRNGATTGEMSAVNVAGGAAYLVPANWFYRTGYTFSGWKDGAGIDYLPGTVIASVTANITLIAQWEVSDYVVSFDANGGTVRQQTKTVTYNTPYGKLPEPVRSGYRFAGWFTDITGGAKITEETIYTMAASRTIYAQWIVAIKDTPAKSIEKIKKINPDYLLDGKTQPTFQFSATNNKDTNTSTIFEEVWIEVPCDTDEDGKRDLIRIQIARPKESGEIIDPLTGETKVSLSVLMEHSPYRNSHNSDIYSRTPNWPVVHDQLANPSTAAYQYLTDIKTKKPRANNWYWGSEAQYWDYNTKEWTEDKSGGNPSWYITPRAGADGSAWFIPESRGDKEVVYQGNWLSGSMASVGANYQYYYTRGYAIIISASLANNFNELESEGFSNCADVEETLVPMAIINWLNGRIKGYTDRSATKEVVATWCNGNVAMTGQSYVGTLPEATACSGVDGIKAILPSAAISSWYDYYRGNGAVVAPYNYQGEDADMLADNSFGFGSTAAFQVHYNAIPKTGVAKLYEEYLNKMHIDQDRKTGDYNWFWDDRNYLTTIDSVPDDCGVMIMHGLRDWNVKTKQPDQFYRALKDAGKTVKEIWHLGTHATVWDKVDSNYFKYYHAWLDHFVYGLDNGAPDNIPEISMPNHNNVNWEFHDKWPIAGSTDTKYFLGAPTANKAGGLLTAAPASAAIGTIKDDLVANASILNAAKTSVVNGNLNTWENRLFNPADLNKLSSERLAFATDPLTAPLRINGTVRVGLELASDTPWGSISAVLLEVGPNYRAFGTSATLETLNSGFGASNINLNNYTISNTPSQYLIVTRGYGDIQNPNPARETYLNAPKDHGYIPAYYYQTQAITPGEKNKYYFEFEPMDYTFKAGTRLALYVYSTDYRTTIIPENPPTFTLYAGENTFVELPIVPTYSIFYDANGAASQYDDLGGYSDSYPKAGQSAKAWEGGYRIPGTAVGNASVNKLVAPAGWTFRGWNTEADGSGTAYAPGERIADAEMGDMTLFAQWYGKPVTIEAADAWASPGGTVDVAYTIKDNSFGFTTFDLELPFNERFIPLTVTPADKIASKGDRFFVSNVVGDVVKVVFASADNISGDGLLFTVTYQVPAAVLPVFDELLDVNIKSIKIEPIKDQIVDLAFIVKPGTLVIGILGDIDGDGKITPEDAMLLLQMYVGLVPWTPRALLLGDVNQDGFIDPVDASLILRMIVGG
ncbi:MAG: CocE/NonD family hydrolase [Clostridiales bacterium]|nr:CocE/NonD family hydrolase [Clostridiales bacterium]